MSSDFAFWSTFLSNSNMQHVYMHITHVCWWDFSGYVHLIEATNSFWIFYLFIYLFFGPHHKHFKLYGPARFQIEVYRISATSVALECVSSHPGETVPSIIPHHPSQNHFIPPDPAANPHLKEFWWQQFRRYSRSSCQQKGWQCESCSILLSVFVSLGKRQALPGMDVSECSAEGSFRTDWPMCWSFPPTLWMWCEWIINGFIASALGALKSAL